MSTMDDGDSGVKVQPLQLGLKCGVCNRAYSNKKVLFKHLHKHEHPSVFSCLECGKTFPTKTRLNIHSRIHSGERPFKCHYCEIYFASRFQQKLHQRRHTGEKPYSCSYCNKVFSSSSGLRQHVKTHTKESPFPCSQCSKSFKQKEKLKQHERIHTGVRPFMCDQCPKTFRIKNALVRHMRIHSGETFKCGQCPKEFGELYALKKHHRNKHDKLSFTGPSDRLSFEAQTSTVPFCDSFNLNKSGNKVRKHPKNSKSKATVTTQNQRKEQSKRQNPSYKCKLKKCTSGSRNKFMKCALNSKCKVKKCASDSKCKLKDSDLNKDVVEKLHLAIGQRNNSALVDENGWHRIPLLAASDLLNRNTENITKSYNGDLKEISADLNDRVEQDEYFVRQNAQCVFNQRIANCVGLDQVTKQKDEVNAKSSEISTTQLHNMVLDEVSKQTNENVATSVICQQAEQISDVGRRRREITHPSTIEYFPATDQSFASAYTEDRESLQFVKDSVQDLTSTSSLQGPSSVPLGFQLQEQYLDRNSLKSSSVFSDSFYTRPNYQQQDMHQPSHEQQMLDHPNFYQLQLPQAENVLETKQHHHKATLHHHPKPYQENEMHSLQDYSDTQHHFDSTSVSGGIQQISQDNEYHTHQFSDLQTGAFSSNPSLIQHYMPQHYQQTSSGVLHGPQISLTMSIQPASSSPAYEHDSSLKLTPSSVSPMLPFIQPLGAQSNQPLSYQHEYIKSNQPLVHQNEAAQSNQLLQQYTHVTPNQSILVQHVSEKSNQQVPLLCNFSPIARSFDTSNISLHRPLTTSNMTHGRQSAGSFSYSRSSVIHHKPTPVISHNHHAGSYISDAWPEYFQMQHPHPYPNEDLNHLCGNSVTNILSQTSSFRVHADAFPNSQHHVVSHSDISQTLGVTEKAACSSMSENNVPENACFNSDPVIVSLSSTIHCPTRNNLSPPKHCNPGYGSQLQHINSPLKDCLHMHPTSAEVVNLVKEGDLSTVNTLPNKFGQTSVHIDFARIQEPVLESPEVGNFQKAQECTNSGDNFKLSHKFITENVFVKEVVAETLEAVEVKEVPSSDNNFEVSDCEDCNEDDRSTESSNEVQQLEKRHNTAERDKTMTELAVSGIGHNGEKDMELTGQLVSVLKMSNEPHRTECVSRYQSASNKVLSSCQKVNKNTSCVGHTSRSLNTTGLNETNHSLHVSSAMLNDKICVSEISKVKKKRLRQNSKKDKDISPIELANGNDVCCNADSRHMARKRIKSFKCKSHEPLGTQSVPDEAVDIQVVTVVDIQGVMDKTVESQIVIDKIIDIQDDTFGDSQVFDNRTGDTISFDDTIGDGQDFTDKSVDRRDESDPSLVKPRKMNISSSAKTKSNPLTSTEEIIKMDFIKRNCIVNKEKNIKECLLCGKRYKQTNNLKTHVLVMHFDELKHKCPTCNKHFPQKSRLERHMKTHVAQKPFPCSQCPQAFTAKKYLDNHLKRHDKQPPIFACGDCEKTFSRRYQLKIHYRTHSGEKPYKCSICSSQFATAFQVRLHERVHSNILPYQCHYCSKSFRSNTNLALHVKRHMNDRPYLCATCGATFYEASKLKAHIRVHTGDHPFICDQCPKTFKVKHLLVRHLRWHNGDTFKCEHCSKPFDEKWILRVHVQKHHS